MNNILKKWKASLVIVGCVVGVGYLANSGENKIEKDTTTSAMINNSSDVLLVSANEKELEYEDIQSDYKELEYLESILNNKYFILINKENKLDKNYVPSDLKKSETKFLDYVEDDSLDSVAEEALNRMFDAAEKDGISLVGVSGYRSYDVQKTLYNTRIQEKGEEMAKAYTAEPGASEHQSGLAIDILCDDYKTLDEGFEDTDAFRWLSENCYKYGFILRYLKGKEDITGYNYEPWHFRYIGNEEVAKDIMNRGLTFEEYINEVKNKIEDLKKVN